MTQGLLTFDCYGTLIDWEQGIAAAFADEARRSGVTLPGRDLLLATYAACEAEFEQGDYLPYREVLARSARCVAERVGWDLPTTSSELLPHSLPSWRPFPDTNAALRRLAGSYRLGILSNVDDDLLRGTLEHLAVPFDVIVTAEQVRSYKPARAHWIEARRREGSRPGKGSGSANSWTHVAQSYFHDVRPALELGLQVVWVNRAGQALRPEDPRPTHEVRDLTQAADLLLSEIPG
ncbi:MAG: HAD hydrolase-like protein [Gemmatimonadetes bacterium]|nr:HAD hydrolase-like protein [Gemmatimonadota bacterium]